MRNTTDLKMLIKSVVLDTGLTKEQVEKAVMSFLGHLQDQVCERTVYIPGFGEMSSEFKSRRYWDINKKQDDLSMSVKPKVKFTPSIEFLRLIESSKS